MLSTRLRASASCPTLGESGDWTLALAGGEGSRLAEYVRRLYGRDIPKQYCCLLGESSMLEHTLARLNRLTPAARTLTVIGTTHRQIAGPQLAGRSDHVFCQPTSRDTGVALFVALAMIKRWAPDAIVTITPTDHYVAPAARYVDLVRSAGNVARRLPGTIVALAAKPTEPDPELGYISVGPPLADVPQVRSVIDFVEKPSVGRAEQLRQAGALWNTMVMVGAVDALWSLGRATVPHLIDLLDSLVPLIDTADEDDAIQYIYDSVRPISFSHGVVERAPERVAAMTLDGIEWSDWGRPERVETVIAMRRSRALMPTLYS